MSRKRTAEDLKAKLAAMSTGSRAPGSEQASRALAGPAPVPTPAVEPEEEPPTEVPTEEVVADAPTASETAETSSGGGVEADLPAHTTDRTDAPPAEPQKVRSKRSPKKQNATKEVDPLDEVPLEKISVQLYAEDVEALDRVEATLKQHGLLGRTTPAAWLLRVAVAHFNESTARGGLERTMKSIKAKDGRGKWRG